MDGNTIEGNPGKNSLDHEKSSRTESITVEGNANVVPTVGMEFESPIAAQLFYNNYAKLSGFEIKIKSSNYDKKDKCLRRMVFSCTKEGYKLKNENVKNPRPDTREGCLALMAINIKSDSEKWVVTKVVTEHTHVLFQANVHFHPAQKDTGPAAKKRVVLPNESGVRTNRQMAAFFKRKEGLRRRVKGNGHRNLIDNQRQLTLQEGDVQTLLDFFNRMQIKNPSFFYSMDISDDGRLRNTFWVDAKAKASYSHFNDVITFDSTHLTSKYDIPFASFVGVNHHGQHILLGCGLLADETKETYTWLFETWLQAMSNHPPISMITNQCGSIQEAIAEVFPGVRHRFCLWNTMKKVPEKLGPLGRDDTFLKRLNDCIYDPLRIEEFERNWLEIVNDYQLRENEWFNMLYEDRERWVPVYLKDTFFAGMSTVHRSESVNAFFDRFVHPKTSLEEFVEQYELAILSQCEKEAHADCNSFHLKLPMKTKSFFEKEAAHIYTREVFFRFQDEICGMPNCSSRLIQKNGAVAKHMVIEIGEDDVGIRKVTEYEVNFDASTTKVDCICRSFEFQGYLCKHALVVLVNSGINQIPSHYILARWRKDAKHSYGLSESHSLVDGSHWMERYDDLCHRTNKFAHDGALNVQTYAAALDALDQAWNKVCQADYSLGKVPESTVESIGRFSVPDTSTFPGVSEPNTESISRDEQYGKMDSTSDQIADEGIETNCNGIITLGQGIHQLVNSNPQQDIA
ncbi:protein FAR1-RELATED SEQUENCE 6-like [Tasmannia lanceolata]|uniref:protein FAR1-RELATED SEQUENCE 6-like n=1 Tax=Tasmannia lanceolata TaxID=3420 RepID=UPI004063DAF7